MCFFHLGQTRLATEDINVALALGYPDKNKLLKKKEAYTAQLSKQTETECNRKAETSNSEVVFEVFHTEFSGRGLKASRNISSGELILVDAAYASALDYDRFDQYCYCCLKKIEHQQFYPCRRCTQVRYCTLECSFKSWSTHSYECQYIDLIKERTGNINVSAKILSLKILFSNPIEDILCQDYRDERSDLVSSYATLTKLVDHENDAVPTTVHSAFMTAFVIEKKLSDMKLSPEDLITIAGRLLKHARQTKWNAMSISHRSLCDSDFDSDVKVLREDLIGIGLFLRQLLINHSCRPNIRTAMFEGDCVHLEAIQDIAKGNEILNSYGMFSKWQSFKVRQEYLKENYCFQCGCSACARKEEALIRCLKCPRKGCNSALLNGSCISCGRKTTEEEEERMKQEVISANQTIAAARKFLDEYLREAEDDTSKCRIIEQIFTDGYNRLRKVLFRDHRDVIMTLDTMCSFYLKTGFNENRENVLKLAHKLLKDTKRVFNEEVHMFNTYLKIIEMYKLFKGSVEEVRNMAIDAQKLLSHIVYHGSNELQHYQEYFHQLTKQ